MKFESLSGLSGQKRKKNQDLARRSKLHCHQQSQASGQQRTLRHPIRPIARACRDPWVRRNHRQRPRAVDLRRRGHGLRRCDRRLGSLDTKHRHLNRRPNCFFCNKNDLLLVFVGFRGCSIPQERDDMYHISSYYFDGWDLFLKGLDPRFRCPRVGSTDWYTDRCLPVTRQLDPWATCTKYQLFVEVEMPSF